jgi:hypothetical protein
MKINELIQELQDIRHTEGNSDADVVFFIDNNGKRHEINIVEYYPYSACFALIERNL